MYPSTGNQQLQQKMEQLLTPTVTAISPFDPQADAEVLYTAMKGLGTDENHLITILCNRTSSQRTAINQAFKLEYKEDLETKLNSDLSGDFGNLMVALCLPKADFMARELHEAISGLGTNDETLIEILCSGTNQEIRDMNTAYSRLFGNSIETDIRGDTSGDFKLLLVSMANGARDENHIVDTQRAREDAHRLHQAGEGQLGTDENMFSTILTTRSWAQLRQIMNEYQTLHGHGLEKAVVKEFSADAERGLLGILQCAQNRPAYFAQRLNDALKGVGTKDRNLIRLIVSRCDIDLGNIKQEYEKKFGTNLITDVLDDTSGDYKDALISLLG